MKGLSIRDGWVEYGLIGFGVGLLILVVSILVSNVTPAYRDEDSRGVQRIEYPDYTCFRGRYSGEFSCVKK